MGLEIPPLRTPIMLESNPLKSTMLDNIPYYYYYYYYYYYH